MIQCAACDGMFRAAVPPFPQPLLISVPARNAPEAEGFFPPGPAFVCSVVGVSLDMARTLGWRGRM